MKNLTAFLISAALCLGLCIGTASAAAISPKCALEENYGENETWSFDESTGTLSITQDMYMSDFPWREYSDSILTVDIAHGVTAIDYYAFQGCAALTKVIIPDSVTSIGMDAFENCSSLTDIAIPQSVTSIGSGAFNFCSALTEIIIPDSVTEIEHGAFEYCSSLADITLSGNLTHIGSGAFNYTAYYNDNSNWEDGALYIDKYLLATNESLSSDYTVKDGTRIISGDAFKNHFMLSPTITSITIPDSVTVIDRYAFSSCTALTNIEMGNGVAVIGDYAFSNCSALTSVDIPKSVNSIGSNAFSYCSSLESIVVDNENLSYYSDGGVLFNKENAELMCYPMGKQNSSYTVPQGVASIGFCAFNNAVHLSKLSLSESVVSIAESAFSECTALTEVSFPNSIAYIDAYAFGGCASLASISLPNSVIDIGVGAFEDTAYYNNENNWEDGVLYIGKHLIKAKEELCGSYKVKRGTVTIAIAAFRCCKELTSINIPQSITHIGASAFSGCYALTSVQIPDGITCIGNGMFSTCFALTSIIIPRSVTYIGWFAFEHCDALSTVYYGGNAEQWNAIENDNSNKAFDFANVVFNYVPLVLGDINEDGKVDNLDAASVLKHDAKLITLEGTQYTAADVNTDGTVNNLDAALILKFDAKLITEF